MSKKIAIKKGDIFVFQNKNNEFNSLICTSTQIEKSPFFYNFAGTTTAQNTKPTIDEIKLESFYGVGNRKANFFKYHGDEIDKMWQIHPEIKPCHLGSYSFTIWRKDFMKFKDKFENIGNISIIEYLDETGSGGMNASDYELLLNLFSKKFEIKLEERGQKKFKIEAIIREEK